MLSLYLSVLEEIEKLSYSAKLLLDKNLSSRFSVCIAQIELDGVICPGPTKIHLTNFQNQPCNLPSHDKNQRCHLVVFEILSILLCQFAYHSRHEILQSHLDQSCIYHHHAVQTYRHQCNLETLQKQ